MSVYNFAEISSGKFAVFVYFEFVGIYVVDAVLALQELAEVGESAAKNGYLVSATLQYSHESVYALGDRHLVCDVLENTRVESLEQSNAACKALLKVDFATHGALCYRTHLCANTSTFCQFVDALGLNKCRVHIEADESAHTAVHVVLLEREVDLHLVRYVHQFLLHGSSIGRCAAERELDAGAPVVFRVLYAHATCESEYGVDVQSLLRYNLCCSLNLLGRK